MRNAVITFAKLAVLLAASPVLFVGSGALTIATWVEEVIEWLERSRRA